MSEQQYGPLITVIVVVIALLSAGWWLGDMHGYARRQRDEERGDK